MKILTRCSPFFLLLALALLFPTSAFAADGDYTIDELSSEVAVETNASVHVIERQVVTFDRLNRGYIWYLHVPEDGESVRISSVRVAPVDDGGTLIGDWTRLQLVDSHPSLQGREPGDAAVLSTRGLRTQPWYSFNIGDGIVRCWFPVGDDVVKRAEAAAAAAKAARVEREKAATEKAAASESPEPSEPSDAPEPSESLESSPEPASDDASGADESNLESDDAAADEDAPIDVVDTTRYVIEADYTVAHRVRAFRDVGELYWRYANSSLPVDAFDVNLQVTLPVPEGSLPIAPGTDVVAWGHGPDDGTLEVSEDGTVTCHVDEIVRGNYAEVHVIFPTWWMDNVTSGSANVFSEARRAAAASEESQWVDAEKRGETWDFKVRVLLLALAVVVLLVGVIAVARGGRSARSRRALVRTAATIAILALGAQLFFREPMTTVLLFAIAIAVAAVSLMLPMEDEAE